MQPSIVEQLELEKRMVARGMQKYHDAKKDAIADGRGAEASFARRLIATHIPAIADKIRDYTEAKGPGTGAKLRKHVGGVDPEQAAYFVLRTVFTKCFGERCSLTEAGAHIGRYIEDEIRFSKFREKNKNYYDAIIADFKRKGTTEYRHRHRVLTHQATKLADKWKPWRTEERVQVGVKLLDILEQATQIITRQAAPKRNGKKTTYHLLPSPEVLEWINKFDDYAEFLSPERMPCVIPPDPWTGLHSGGYYSPDLRTRTPFVLNVRSKRAKQLIADNWDQMHVHVNGANAQMQTGYSVNTRVLDVLKQCWQQGIEIGIPSSVPIEIPPCPLPPDIKKSEMSEVQLNRFNDWKREAATLYTAEHDRIAKSFQVATIIRSAAEYSKYDAFWYVFQCDFRGRYYAATSGFSPQGPDIAKATLQLATGKRLGADGMYGLKVHAANVAGFDKASLDDRAAYIDARRESILRVADDPMSNRDVWGDADKPWQFLAACFALADAWRNGTETPCHLAFGADGSCNGIQHFSAMLRDRIGGAATNLIPAPVPSDIYSDVARIATERLRRDSDPMAGKWLAVVDGRWSGTLPRKLAKTPVMTLPYGSTQRTCTDSIFAYCYSEDRKLFDSNFQAAIFLTPILWDSISDTVVKARQAMDWLQDVAGRLAGEGWYMEWTSPSGFPVHQATYRIATKQINTVLCGRVQLRVGTFTDKLDKARMENGAAPNFVHSMDAAHCAFTIQRAQAMGLRDFWMVHDSYGCHMADWRLLNTALREAFVEMYETHNPLETLRDFTTTYSGVVLPDPPDIGELDIRGVLDSAYFFA